MSETEDLATITQELARTARERNAWRQRAGDQRESVQALIQERGELLEEIARLRASSREAQVIIEMSATPWPLYSVLEKLANAAEHLLKDHSCDVHGHEEIREAMAAARKAVERLLGEP